MTADSCKSLSLNVESVGILSECLNLNRIKHSLSHIIVSRLQYFFVEPALASRRFFHAFRCSVIILKNMQTAIDFGREREAVRLNIGRIIRDELRRQGRSAIWLASKINCDRRNVYDIFSRSYIDTGLLFRISHILNFDFFQYYSEALRDSGVQ